MNIRISKKQIFFLVLLAACLLLPKIGLAADKVGFWTVMGKFPQIIVLIGPWTIANLFAHFANWATTFLLWIVGGQFTTLSYTNPDTNPIIQTGLNITQPFANIILVLVLVYIAIATILRLAEHNTQKLLITFIAVALLVNFTPVICGVIVDASNIVMNYFAEGVKGAGLTEVSTAIQEGVKAAEEKEGFSSIIQKDISAVVAIAIGYFIFAIFEFVLTVLIFVLGIALIFRYCVIWILVILSPIAFVSIILPATKSWWKQWWEQFLKWAFYGATLMLFLYLAASVSLVIATSSEINQMGGGGWAQIGNSLLPHIATIVFLLYAITLSSGIAGGISSKIIGASGKASLGLGLKGLKGAGRMARAGGRKLRTGVRKGFSNRWEKERVHFAKHQAAGFDDIGPGGQSTGAKVARRALFPVTLAAMGLRRLWGKAGSAVLETEKKGPKGEIQKSAEDVKEQTPAETLQKVRSFDENKKIGSLVGAIREGKLKELQELGLTDKEIKDIMKVAALNQAEAFKGMRDVFPKQASEIAEELKLPSNLEVKLGIDFDINKPEDKVYGSLMKKIFANANPKAISQMDVNLMQKPELAVIMKFWSPQQVKAGIEDLGPKFLNKFNKAISGIGGIAGIEQAKNFKLAAFLRSSAARGLGVFA